jgi:hypothetical protein
MSLQMGKMFSRLEEQEGTDEFTSIDDNSPSNDPVRHQFILFPFIFLFVSSSAFPFYHVAKVGELVSFPCREIFSNTRGLSW